MSTNGNGHGDSARHAEPVAAQVASFTAAASDVDQVGGRAVHRAPATGEAADELAAMLASALASTPTDDRPTPEPATPEPAIDEPAIDEPAAQTRPAMPWTDADLDDFLSEAASVADPVDPAPAVSTDSTSDSDWDDLASLAAELELDGATANTPAAAEVAPPPAPETQLPGDTTGMDLPPPAPHVPSAPPPPPPPPAMPATPASGASAPAGLDELSDQDLAALYESAIGDHLEESEHVPSEPMPPPAPEATAVPAVTVDLGNFTARGNPVARNSAAPRRFGRKR